MACGKRWLAAKQSGVVLSIVTTYAFTGSAYVIPSAMGKAAVLAMTRSLAVEWGRRGIRLNAIAPGPFPTQGAWERLVPRDDLARAFETRNPLGRAGRHEELADLAVFMVCDQSGYMNGEVVVLDGGEWLQGAGQFNFLSQLSDADWDNFKARKG
jgi:NAD(P)-dependent dehydrogenase (short-subunit alcohol dehydrogenase family)